MLGDDKFKEPKLTDLLTSLDKISFMLDKAYLNNIHSEFQVIPFEKYNEKIGTDGYKISFEANIRGIKVHRWVYDKDEKIGDRLKNVLSVFSKGDSSLGMIVRRTPVGCEMMFGLKNETTIESRNEESNQNRLLLKKTIEGNFPGSLIENVNIDERWMEIIESKSISCLTNVSSEKSKILLVRG